jgi:hypothetical protein
MSYYNKYGLLNACDNDETVQENSILYSLELAQKIIGFNYHWDKILNYMQLCKVRTGLYHQRPVNECPVDEQMSHDQLTAFIIASKLLGLEIHKEIWAEIKRQNLGYNDWNVTSYRPLHPRDIIYYGMMCGSKAWYLLYPIFLLISIISCWGTYYKRPQIDVAIVEFFKTGIWNRRTLVESSGKLLSWTRTVTLMPKTFKILSWVIEKTSIMGSWNDVFLVYFPDPNHPLNN